MKISGQIYDFTKRLHPAQRRAIKAALRELEWADGAGAMALINELECYHRLKTGKFRVIFRFLRDGEISCEFIEERGTVYKEFRVLRDIIEGRRK
jgi:mRNA-degrading endonuclease RelE of RelBE toxin-antitoxin system